MTKEQNLAHTKWLCRYHIVFTPKYGRKVMYGKCREEIGKIIRQFCNCKGIEIIDGHMMIDHVHMLAMIPSKYAISSVMGYIAGNIYGSRIEKRSCSIRGIYGSVQSKAGKAPSGAGYEPKYMGLLNS